MRFLIVKTAPNKNRSIEQFVLLDFIHRLGLYAVLVFPRFLRAVKCAVAGSLIATGV
jgi:hypothetical protein